MPPPHSFPCSAFTLTRMQQSGRVLGIRVEGPYVEPGPPVEALRPEFRFGDVEILDGDLESVADALLREHLRRTSKAGA